MSPEDDRLSAAEVADYDQALADNERFLNDLVHAYIGARQLDVANNIPEAASVMALAGEISENIAASNMASILTVAILALADHCECMP